METPECFPVTVLLGCPLSGHSDVDGDERGSHTKTFRALFLPALLTSAVVLLQGCSPESE